MQVIGQRRARSVIAPAIGRGAEGCRIRARHHHPGTRRPQQRRKRIRDLQSHRLLCDAVRPNSADVERGTARRTNAVAGIQDEEPTIERPAGRERRCNDRSGQKRDEHSDACQTNHRATLARKGVTIPRRRRGSVKRITFLGGALTAVKGPAFAQRSPALVSAIARAAAASSGLVAVYARSMNGKPPLVTYHDRDVFPSASVIKLVIMISAFAFAERHGEAFFDKTIALRANDLVGGSDFLAGASPGQRFSVRSLIRAMITVSDNSASNALITELGFERINQTAVSIGLEETELRRHFLDTPAIIRNIQNVTSARDMGSLLYRLERGAREGVATVASPRSCRAMIGILLAQEDREKIAQGLPNGVPLANKTGEITGVRNDVGIVDPFGDNPYVLAILTKNLDNYAAGRNAIAEITRLVHAAMKTA